MLATLTRQLGGDLGLAEDALQDAFTAAAEDWPRRGVPGNPGAWLTVAARRKAIDRLRRRRALNDRLPTLHRLMVPIAVSTSRSATARWPTIACC
ncbi:MAG: sigma factor [Thermomicrobiales bacterium]